MKVYKLTSWIEQEYGPNYDEKIEYFLAKNTKSVLQELSNRGIVFDKLGVVRKYYVGEGETKVWRLDKIKITKVKECHCELDEDERY